MTKFSELTRGFNELSDKQYALLRDAGFSPEFLSNKKQPFYQLQHPNIPSEKLTRSQDVKPTEQQLEYIRSQIADIEFDDDLASYADARYAIRTIAIAIEQNTDERYIKYINDYCLSKKQKNDERVERRRKQKMREQAPDTMRTDGGPPADAEDSDNAPIDMSDFLQKLQNTMRGTNAV